MSIKRHQAAIRIRVREGRRHRDIPGRLSLKRLFALSSLIALSASFVFADETSTDTRPGLAPDIREDETELKLQRGDFVIVPIPISNPTLGSGLVAGSAYFYAQTEEQKKAQPASLTGAGAMYTSNDSKVFVVAQQNYWRNNTWRFTGAIGVADMRLSILAPEEIPEGSSVDWRIDGQFVFARLARKLGGDWYGGFYLRTVDADQSFEFASLPMGLDLGNVNSSGLGASVEYDTRDMPLNSYSGRYFKVDALFNDEIFGSNKTYQSYSLAFSSYHEMSESLVLAWELRGCLREGEAPLWDACTVKLRGFSATDYLRKETVSGQVEARWRLGKRWGLVGFAGAGYAIHPLIRDRDNDAIPSYGVGVRFMVLAAKRINLRVDYARSADSDAVYVSVGEAF